MLLELLTAGLVGGATSAAVDGIKWVKKKIHDKKHPPEPVVEEEEDNGAENFIELLDKDGANMKCPKCTRHKVPTDGMEICHCEQFPRAHFHRVCGGCKYDFVMKPHDEKYRPKGSKKK